MLVVDIAADACAVDELEPYLEHLFPFLQYLQ